MTGVALCGTGGVVFCFGNQLLLGALVGGVAAYLNHRQGWIDWRGFVGASPAPVSPPSGFAGQTPPSALDALNQPVEVAPAPTPQASAPAWQVAPLALDAAPIRAGVVALAIALLVGGVFFWGAGTFRSLEGFAAASNFGCAAPCGLERGVWVQVMPDSTGNLAAQPVAGLVEVRLNFHDDAPGVRDVNRDEFSLSGPDPKVKYVAALERRECSAWTLRLQLDDAGKMATVCFAASAETRADPSQLTVNWGNVAIPLGGPGTFSFAIGQT
jgi:hypothetical protein